MERNQYGYTVSSDANEAQVLDGGLCAAAGKRAHSQGMVSGERDHTEDLLLQIKSST